MASPACLHLKHFLSSSSPSDSLLPSFLSSSLLFTSLILLFSSLTYRTFHPSIDPRPPTPFFPSSSLVLLIYIMSPTASPQRGRHDRRAHFESTMQRGEQRYDRQYKHQQLPSEREQQFESHENHSSDRQESRQQSKSTFMSMQRNEHTHPAWWLVGSCCILLWIIIILGGIVVLIVYLVFRPKSPLLDIQSATLNAAYLDTGTLLNADITILANFSNPNRKVDVAFSYVQVDLYFMGTMIATQEVEPFAERRGQSALKSLHMMASEVALPQDAAKEWQRGTTEEGVALEVRGRFRTRSDLGKLLHFTYWLYGRCTIVIGAPPSGVLLSSRCRTKR